MLVLVTWNIICFLADILWGLRDPSFRCTLWLQMHLGHFYTNMNTTFCHYIRESFWNGFVRNLHEIVCSLKFLCGVPPRSLPGP